LRVALYARVSTQEQAQHGLSIGAQLAALEEWAKPHVIVGEYVDAGISARSPISKRPELQRLLRELDNVDCVVFTKLDRWTRNIREYYKAQDALDAHGVAWRAIHEDYETETAAGRLKVNIMLSVAQDEADRTSERIKAVFADKRRKGLIPSGKAPLGLEIVNGRYQITEKADITRAMFQDYIAKRSTTYVAEDFHMTPVGVRALLRNKNLVENGVVDEDTFKTANEILGTRSQRRVHSGEIYIFGGLIRCGKCGGATYCAKSKGYYYYRCVRHRDHGPCEGTSVNEAVVENYLLDNIVSKAEDMNLTITKKSGRAPDIGKLTARLDKLTDLYLNDLITREKYEADYKKTQEAILEAQRRPKTIDTEELTNILGAYQSLSRAAKKAFWSKLVKRIVIDDKKISFELYA